MRMTWVVVNRLKVEFEANRDDPALSILATNIKGQPDRSAMRIANSTQNAALAPIFQHWLRDHAAVINQHPKGPQFLLPPA